MLRFLVLFVLCGLSACFLGTYLPHWGLMLLVATLAALVGGKGWIAFFSAALAVGAVWFMVPYLITQNSGSALPEKMAQIMGFEQEILLIVATSGIGFLIAGFAALTGNRFRKLFERDKKNY